MFLRGQMYSLKAHLNDTFFFSCMKGKVQFLMRTQGVKNKDNANYEEDPLKINRINYFYHLKLKR